jgi:hypothetical protein
VGKGPKYSADGVKRLAVRKDVDANGAGKTRDEVREQQLKEIALAKLEHTIKQREARVRFYKRDELRFLHKAGKNAVAAVLWCGYSMAIAYRRLDMKYPLIMEFLRFWMVSNVVTIFQFVAMPVLKAIFSSTSLVDINFQVWQVGKDFYGDPYYVFSYAEGPLIGGGGGGLAYFLAVQITLFMAQLIGFPLQRNVAFKSVGNPWYQGMWYLIAYVAITLFAGAAQGIYKAPLYNLLINTMNLGKTGETMADVISMFIYAIISFWIFYPIFKIIFKKEGRKEGTQETA